MAFSDPSMRDIAKFADYREALREAVKAEAPRSRHKAMARVRRATRVPGGAADPGTTRR